MADSSNDSFDRDDQAEGEGYEDLGFSEPESDNDLDSVTGGTTERLNITTTYQPQWTGVEAFRELYQNWRDAIFRSFGVDSKNTDLEAKEDKRKRRFVITARRQRSSPALSSGSGTESELLGFIRYTYDKEELGTLEIANFKARLQLRHLRMGGSTKQKDETQAGQHGEGMKLAAMVLRRSPQRYSVRCLSSGCYWNFQLDNRKSLFCKLTRPKDETLRQKKAKYRQRERDRLPRLLEANIWEDVCVEVGYVRASKGDTGEERKTQKIPLLEFQRWLEVTIDINPPTEIVRTESGDLILDEKHKNKAYLRGLLLPQSSITGKTCHYGYNFLRGQTDRDRSNIVNAWEEASRITNIWRDALLSGPEIVAKYDLVRKYTRLLLDQNQLAADVNLADQYISRKVAGLIWRHLTVEVPQKDGSKLFYYCDKDGPECTEIITTSLRRKPSMLPRNVWAVFRRYDLCRSPMEEQIYQFNKASRSVIPKTSFAGHVIRSLDASLSITEMTNGMKIVFVDGEDFGLEVLYSQPEQCFKIQSKYLSLKTAHSDAYCEWQRMDEAGILPAESRCIFWCDHIIVHLFTLMLDKLSIPPGISRQRFGEHKSLAQTTVSTRLSQMPRGIKVCSTNVAQQLQVSWVLAESAIAIKYSKARLSITLHMEYMCSAKRKALVYPTEVCNCPQKYVLLDCDNVVFDGLGTLVGHFPMISRDEPGAFYGVAPQSVRPIGPGVPRSCIKDSSPATPDEMPATPRETSGETWRENVSLEKLPWQSGFPIDRDWYSTRNKSGEGVLIAKRRSTAGQNGSAKRVRFE